MAQAQTEINLLPRAATVQSSAAQMLMRHVRARQLVRMENMQTTHASLTINDLCEAYLADRRNPFAEKRCKHPESLKSHLVAARRAWGAMSVDEFAQGSKARVKAKIQEWREQGASQHTVRKRISVLRTVLRFAVEEEMIDRVPTFKLPVNGPSRERYVDPVLELPAILKEADHPRTPQHIRLNLHLSLRTGQRQGAIADLKWEHVDFDARVIRFRDTETPDERSKKRRTDIPMDDDLLAIMREAQEAAETTWVLEWRGRRAGNVYHGTKALYRRAGVANLHRHDLRRTAATLVHRGTDGDMKAAASFIGDTEQMAAKHYVLPSAESRLKPVQAVSEILARARKAA